MTHPLYGAHLKIERTWEVLDALNQEIRAFVETEPYGYWIEPEPDSDWMLVRVEARRAIPDHLGLLFGDAVHNVRSALNHLAYELAVAGSGPGRSTQWPIYKEPADWNAHHRRHLEGVNPAYWAAIEHLQPYQDPENLDWLVRLKELDDADKHRQLQPAQVAPAARDLVFTPPVVEVEELPSRVYMAQGAVVARMRTTEAVPHVHVEARFGLGFLFGTGPWGGTPRDVVQFGHGVNALLIKFGAIAFPRS